VSRSDGLRRVPRSGNPSSTLGERRAAQGYGFSATNRSVGTKRPREQRRQNKSLLSSHSYEEESNLDEPEQKDYEKQEWPVAN